MREHHIGVREGIALLTIFMSAKLFLAFPRTMAEMGGPAAWMVVLFGLMSAGLSLFLIDRALAAAPGKSLLGAAEAGLGSVLGTLVNLALLGFGFAITAITLRQFSENLLAVFLPRSPLQFVMGSYLMAALLVAYLGLEALSRTAWLLSPWVLLSFTTLLFGALVTFTAPGGLTPFWGPGIAAVMTDGLIRVGLGAEIIALGIVAPAIRKVGQVRTIGLRSLALTGLLMLAAVVAYSLFFPYPSSARIAFPLLQMSRLIVAGRWFQRVEAVYLIIWVVLATLYIAMGIWLVARGLAEVFRVPNPRHLLLAVALLSYSVAIWPDSLVQAQTWQADILRANAWVVTHLTPALVWAGLAIRGGGGKTGAVHN